MERDETTVCPICGGSNIYESGEFLGCADCRTKAPETAAWVDAGACPLCSAPGTRTSRDEANDVRVSYCLHCGCAILWRSEVQP